MSQQKTITKTRSICGYCGVGCSVDIMTRDNRIVGIQPAMDGPANEGALCVKGQFAYDYVHHPDRLTEPLVRRADGQLHPPPGTKRSMWPRPVSVALSTNMDATASTASPRAARPAKPTTSCRSSSAPASAPTRSTTAAVLDTPPPSPVWRQSSGGAPCPIRFRTWKNRM